jgi:hypothetical protein
LGQLVHSADVLEETHKQVLVVWRDVYQIVGVVLVDLIIGR